MIETHDETKRRIGITTWYRNGNYGGTLQAVGLLKTLKKLGIKAEFTDYCPVEASLTYKITRLLKNIYVSFVYPHSYKSRRMIYQFIADELPQSPRFYNYDALTKYANQNYCAAICGSDQIWNSFDGIEPYYFLSYMNGKRIAYAPSIGLNDIKQSFRLEFNRCIAGLDSLSIREEKGRDIILAYTGRDAKVVLDPSMLLNRSEWLGFASSPQEDIMFPSKGYILCYFIGDNARYAPFVQALSERLHQPVRYITTKSNNRRTQTNTVACGVRGFISLINHTECFLTDSYHGFLFGLSLQVKRLGLFRRFAEDDLRCQNSRIDHVLSTFHVEDCVVSKDRNVDDFLDIHINTQNTEKTLAVLREQGIEYLRHALELPEK